MNSFATMQDIEGAVADTCQLINDNIDQANEERLFALAEELVSVAKLLNEFGATTDEWTCYEACQEYREQLRQVHQALVGRLT